MTANPTPKVPGRVLAWVALLTALGASVAANIAYARPDLGPRLSAGVAPVLVVLAAAMLERVPLATARWWQRWLSGLGLAVVAGTAFVVSYMHQYALVIEYGNPPLTATLLPISIDGLIVMASVCLAVIAERRRDLARDVAVADVAAAATRGAGLVLSQQQLRAPEVSGFTWTVDTPSPTSDVHVDKIIQPAPRASGASANVGTPLIGGNPEMSQTLRPDATPGTRNLAGRTGARSTKIGTGSAHGTEPRNRTRPASRQVEPTGDLTEAARTVAGELTAAGRKVSRDALAAGLRARGHRVGTDRAADLARTLTAA